MIAGSEDYNFTLEKVASASESRWQGNEMRSRDYFKRVDPRPFHYSPIIGFDVPSIRLDSRGVE
jgi:hypothetical protein